MPMTEWWLDMCDHFVGKRRPLSYQSGKNVNLAPHPSSMANRTSCGWSVCLLSTRGNQTWDKCLRLRRVPHALCGSECVWVSLRNNAPTRPCRVAALIGGQLKVKRADLSLLQKCQNMKGNESTVQGETKHSKNTDESRFVLDVGVAGVVFLYTR